jgi:hypothetical protein
MNGEYIGNHESIGEALDASTVGLEIAMKVNEDVRMITVDVPQPYPNNERYGLDIAGMHGDV